MEHKLRTLSLFRISSYNRDRCLNLCFDCYNSKKEGLLVSISKTPGQTYLVNKPGVILNKLGFIVLVDNKLFTYSVY